MWYEISSGRFTFVDGKFCGSCGKKKVTSGGGLMVARRVHRPAGVVSLRPAGHQPVRRRACDCDLGPAVVHGLARYAGTQIYREREQRCMQPYYLIAESKKNGSISLTACPHAALLLCQAKKKVGPISLTACSVLDCQVKKQAPFV
jgi:hypothetical protein